MRILSRMGRLLGLLLLSLACDAGRASCSSGEVRESTFPSLQVIPTPRIVTRTPGAFTFSNDVRIVLEATADDDDRFTSSQLAEEIRASLGLGLTVTRRLGGRPILLGRLGQRGFAASDLGLGSEHQLDSLGREGYVLCVTPQRIFIAGGSGTGLFYGVQTLKHLLRTNGGRRALPCVTILDWPSLRYRGWMHDISRGPIPTMAFLKQIIVTMAEYKQNCFTLYTEHVFRLRSHPEIAPIDGISAEQVGELSAFAATYHIELIGNAQSFGHMENMLTGPFYHQLRETPWVVSPSKEETYEFLKEAYAEILPAYRSSMFHINCDEVTGLGSGPAKRMVDSLGAAGAYAYHIGRISEIVRPYGKRLLMWGDIAVGNPQIIERLPRDLVIVSWGYHAAESFDDAILPFTKTGFEFMVAPGVSCWGQVWPDMTTATVNISNYVRDGAALGTMGVMNTVWVDDGENLFHHNWHGLVWGAECAWHPLHQRTGVDARKEREARVESFNHAFDATFFGVPGVTQTLFLFDSLRALPVRGLVTNSGVWSSMLEQYAEQVSEEAGKSNERVVREAQLLIRDLQALRSRVRRNTEVLDVALFAARRVLFTGEKNLARIALARTMNSPDSGSIAQTRGRLTELLTDLHRLKAEYVRLWERENRSWWLHRVMQKYDRLGNQLLDLDKVVFVEPYRTLHDGKRLVRLRTPFADKPIYYTVGAAEPTMRSPQYVGPVAIDRSSLVRARVLADNKGYDVAEKYILVHRAVGKLHKLNSRYSLYSPAYAAGGDMGLLDGLRGSENFADGCWQGYQGQDLDIVIDLERPTQINKITIGLLQQSYSWILMPERVQVWVSEDGDSFSLVRDIPRTVDPREEGTIVRDVTAEFSDFRTRFLRVMAKTQGKLPAWHHAAGNDAFIFADEIVVE